MTKEDRNFWISIVLGALTAVVILFGFVVSVSAWPYQLNLSNGILSDLNTSDSNSTNFTIYVLHNYTNISYTNYTNINYTNLTCINCTYINYTNYTSYINSTMNSSEYYNSLDTNAKFLSINDFNIYKSSAVFPSRIEFDTLVGKLNELTLNVTSISDSENETSHIGLWILCFAGVILGVISIFMIQRSGQNYGGQE